MTPQAEDPVTTADCRERHQGTTRLFMIVLAIVAAFPVGLLWTAERANEAIEQTGSIRGDLQSLRAEQNEAHKHISEDLAEIKADIRAIRPTP